MARRPTVALALVVATVVAVLPVVAAPLFLSSAGNATLHARIDQTCPWLLGSQISVPQNLSPVIPDAELLANGATVIQARSDAEEQAAVKVIGLGPAVHTFARRDVELRTPGGDGGPARVNLLARDGFTDHVEVLAGPMGTGLWLPEHLAVQLRSHVGDRLSIQPAASDQVVPVLGENGRVTTRRPVRTPIDMPVAAIYRDLREARESAYWCTVTDLYQGAPGSDEPVLDLVLLDTTALIQIGQAHYLTIDTAIERAPARSDLTLAQAGRTAGGTAEMHRTLRATYARLPHNDDAKLRSYLIGYSRRADLVVASLLSTVAPISAAGLLAGLGVLVGSGLFWVRRRQRELVVLAAHGAGAASLGLKALLETGPVILAGAALGWLVSTVLVRGVGPSRLVDTAAIRWSLGLAGACATLAMLVVAAAAAVACRGLAGRSANRSAAWLAHLPWEVVPLAAAAVIWMTGDDARLVTFDDGLGTVARLPVRLLLPPVLAIVGVAALAGRLGVRWLHRQQARPGGNAPAWYLGRRRVVQVAATAGTLAVLTAIPIGLASFGATVTGSVDTTVASESRIRLGADVVITLAEPAPVPASIADRATAVERLDGAQVGGVRATLLAVDPASFTRGAFWDGRIPGTPLRELAARLRPPGADGGGAVAVGTAPIPSGSQIVTTAIGRPVHVAVERVPLLPAEAGGYPVLLVARDVLRAFAEGSASPASRAESQLWVRADRGTATRAAAEANLPVVRIRDANQSLAGTIYQPITYTFDYLAALSLLAGIVTTVGFLLYLESRVVVHRRSFVVLRRLGLRPRAHRRALFIELGLPLIAGLTGGLLVAGALVAILHRTFDVDQSTQPGTIVDLPVTTVAGIVVVVAITVVTSTIATHIRIIRARPAEVLRDVG